MNTTERHPVLVSHDGSIRYTPLDVALLFYKHHLQPREGVALNYRRSTQQRVGCAIGAIGLDLKVLRSDQMVANNHSLVARLSHFFPTETIQGITRGFDHVVAYPQSTFWSACLCKGVHTNTCEGSAFGRAVAIILIQETDRLEALTQADETTEIEITPMTVMQLDLVEALT